MLRRLRRPLACLAGLLVAVAPPSQGASPRRAGGDVTPPTITLAVSSKSVTARGSLTLSATATDASGIARVVFYDRGRWVGEDTTAPYTLTVAATSALSGEHVYTAQAHDRRGRHAMSGRATVAVSIAEASAAELLRDSRFGQGASAWWTVGGPALTTSGDQACLQIGTPGEQPWDVLLGQSGLPLERGGTYTLSFTARAAEPTALTVMVQGARPPYPAHFSRQVTNVGSVPRTHSFTFLKTGGSDPAASLQFKLGGQKATRVCLSGLSLRRTLTGPGASPPDDRATVRVNQVGYLPGAPKVAAVAHDSPVPLGWVLRGTEGKVVASGFTRVFGADAASGDFVHRADFTGFRRPGDGYVLEVAGLPSHPFRIAADLYARLKYDALAYFYHNRSGVPIEARHVGDAKWARPAGHAGTPTNGEDRKVGCFAGRDGQGNVWPGCGYTLDVVGGWYDAGDHGKYVVNGGLSAWTLMNLYETTDRSARTKTFPDGRLRIPENANGRNDLLDEARWEMDFLMKMQVPDGQRLALPVGDQSGNLSRLRLTPANASGMAHHKLHGVRWTDLPSRPDQDRQTRFLYPPSTAATLNLAASAAQCARVFARIDGAYARRCLQSARRAWNAAVRVPNVYAYDNFEGGGAYDDTDLRDEFYWAAAELYTTTGERGYLQVLRASPLFRNMTRRGADEDLAWREVTAAGTVTLALVPNGLPATDVARARTSVVTAANRYAAQVGETGYPLPFSSGRYPWGSNSNLMNRALVLGLAHHFTRNTRYRNAALEAMNYVLGRNPLDQSYISGYGERPLTNPHHRFWAQQLDGSFPPPPPGALSGGPNSDPADPTALLLRGRCAPQTCYLDDIGTSSMNEVAINWNAPLAWVATFLDQTGR
ncbi:glycoside hydrolase family 9 protein [Deinococcus sp. YIM 134068]|uniref:glycoside hydrolase family 9 protein n=1 Tax=Deinococcus lichenicola TaxID=3118910 RepID=UPI002F930F0E